MNKIEEVTKTKFCINDREFDNVEVSDAESWQTHCLINNILDNCYDHDAGIYSKESAVEIIQQLIDNGFTTRAKLIDLVASIKEH